jgi:hypothetical protein
VTSSQTNMSPRKRLEYNNGRRLLRDPCRDVIRRTIGARERVVTESVKRRLSRVVGYSPDSNDMRTEAEESLLLEAVTTERLVKTGD